MVLFSGAGENCGHRRPASYFRAKVSFPVGLAARSFDLTGTARDRFRPGERRIYACLDAGPEPKGIPGVLVRWDEEGYGSDTLVYLHYQTLNLNRRWNYVYFDRQEPWPPGTYHVRFFQIGEPMLLLAEGTYVVGSGD